MKNQKGITLVSLIITIIVMLILVAVSVSVVVNSDLIGTSEEAANKYKSAEDDVKNLGTKDIVQGANKSSVQDYLDAVSTT